MNVSKCREAFEVAVRQFSDAGEVLVALIELSLPPGDPRAKRVEDAMAALDAAVCALPEDADHPDTPPRMVPGDTSGKE